MKRDDIAAHLGVTTQAISVPRDRLLSKGIIDATRHGRLSFTVPGFTEYILEQGDQVAVEPGVRIASLDVLDASSRT